MMQNSDRLSFYKACNAKSNKAKCPKFSSFMTNLSDKDYMTATAPKGDNINLNLNASTSGNNILRASPPAASPFQLLNANYFLKYIEIFG